MTFGDGEDHAHAKVERAAGVVDGHVAEGAEVFVHGRDGPAGEIDLGSQLLGQHARRIVSDAAAGDVRGAEQDAADGADRFGIAAVNFQQFVGSGALQIGQIGIGRIAGNFEHQLAGQGVAVGVETGGGQANEAIPCFDLRSVEHLALLHCSNDEAGQIVFAIGVQARHLSGFAADEGTAIGAAAAGDTADDGTGDIGIELADGKVVEEEERLGALHHNVVDAVVDQVFADGIVAAGQKCYLELSTNSIGRTDQHRFFPAGEPEAGSKAAYVGLHSVCECLARVFLDYVDGTVCLIDIYARVFVLDGFCNFHWKESAKLYNSGYSMQKFICCLALCLSAAFADTPSALAIRNARVVTVSGPVIAKGTVLLRNGLIEAVGESVAIPADAWIIEGEGLTVYPGLIDSLSTLGMADAAPAPIAVGTRGRTAAPAAPAAPVATADAAPPARGPEDRPSTTSWLKAADQVKTSDRRIESARNVGFTSAVTFPSRGIVAGQGAVINLAGDRDRQMVIEPSAGMYLTLASAGPGGGFPASLMGVIAYLRQVYIDADYYRAAKEDYAKSPAGKKRVEYDRALEGLLEAPRVLLPATYVRELDRMIRFAGEIKRPALLYGGHEGYRAAALLKQSNTTVLVNLKWPEKPRDSDPEAEDSLKTLELREKAPSTPAALAKAGVKFAFYASGVENPRDVAKAVKKAIDAGLAPEVALRALTLSPAEIYGVSDRLGSIDKGKIANLVVTNGDMFQDRTQVKFVFIDGVKIEPAPETPAAAAAQESQQ